MIVFCLLFGFAVIPHLRLRWARVNGATSAKMSVIKGNQDKICLLNFRIVLVTHLLLVKLKTSKLIGLLLSITNPKLMREVTVCNSMPVKASSSRRMPNA